MTDVPKIYVADLAAYNAGRLRGIWIDATQEPDEIHAEVQAMLAGSPEPVAENGGSTTMKALAVFSSASGRASRRCTGSRF